MPGRKTPAFLCENLGKIGKFTTKLRFYFNGRPFIARKREQNFLTLLPPPLRLQTRIEKKKGWGVCIENEVKLAVLPLRSLRSLKDEPLRSLRSLKFRY